MCHADPDNPLHFEIPSLKEIEALVGNRKGQFSIRVNDQYRICFEWPDGATGPSNVEITDYH
jgi:proteic killer suppression protein